MIKFNILLLTLLISLTGCNSGIPKNVFTLSSSSIQERQSQSRVYNTSNEKELLLSGIAVLQDMGYTIDETERQVGIVSASKIVDATDAGQVAGAFVVALLGGVPPAIDMQQKIKVCFVTLPSRKNKGAFIARVTFQRVIWNTHGQITKSETLKVKQIYTDFFIKLSKSVFLEAHKI